MRAIDDLKRQLEGLELIILRLEHELVEAIGIQD